MKVEALVCPRSAKEIFETDVDALFSKAYMPSDVFERIPDPNPENSDASITVAIVAHPCAIRGHGGRLINRVPCCQVSAMSTHLPYAEWADGFFDYFPLDDGLGLGVQQAIRFTEFQSIHRRELTRGRRVAGLTPRGFYIFQQRFTHSLTRTAPSLSLFEEQNRERVEEAEAESEWVDELVMADQNGKPPDASLEREIEKAIKSFHKFLDEVIDGKPRREAFKDAGGVSQLRKELRLEIRRLRGNSRGAAAAE